MGMRIIVLRHAETIGNANRIVESRAHGRLTYHGVEQAQSAAERLRHESIDIVYTSNQQRAADTAFIVAEYHPAAELIFTHALRERNQGIYEGKRYDEVPHGQYEGDFVHIAPPGGESWRDIERRVGVFLNNLHASHPYATVLLVTHVGPAKAVRSLLADMPLRDSIDQPVANASIQYFEMSGPTRFQAGEFAL